MPTVNDVIVRKPSEQEDQLCRTWPIWTCEASEFEWEYTQTEKCLILEGRVEIKDTPPADQSVSFGPGDFVQLPDGLKCIWKVAEPVKKHYDFE
ncbi:MAG: cupin domain-containing protein [Planctomycetota bacterium]